MLGQVAHENAGDEDGGECDGEPVRVFERLAVVREHFVSLSSDGMGHILFSVGGSRAG